MTDLPPVPAPAQKDHGRAGRNLPVAIASAVVLLTLIGTSLFFWKTAFMFVVAAAVVVAVWELRKGFLAKGYDLPEQPLMLGGVVMVVVAYFSGAPALASATAVAAGSGAGSAVVMADPRVQNTVGDIGGQVPNHRRHADHQGGPQQDREVVRRGGLE